MTTPDDHASEQFRRAPTTRSVAGESNHGAPESISPNEYPDDRSRSATSPGYRAEPGAYFVDRDNYPPPSGAHSPAAHSTATTEHSHSAARSGRDSTAASGDPLAGAPWPEGSAWRSAGDFAGPGTAEQVDDAATTGGMPTTDVAATPVPVTDVAGSRIPPVGDPPSGATPAHADDPMADSAATVRDSTSASDEALRNLIEEVRRFHEHAEKLEAINKKMHERIAELESDLLRASLRPVVKALAELHGEAHRSIRRVREKHEPATATSIARDFEDYAYRIEESLDGLGVGSLGVEVGDAFDRRIHQPTKAVDTTVEADHRRVKEVFHQGFRDVSSEKPIVYAKVSVWNFLRA